MGKWLNGAKAHLCGAGWRVCQANEHINRINCKNFYLNISNSCDNLKCSLIHESGPLEILLGSILNLIGWN